MVPSQDTSVNNIGDSEEVFDHKNPFKNETDT